MKNSKIKAEDKKAIVFNPDVIADMRFNGKEGKFQLGANMLDYTEMNMLAIVNVIDIFEAVMFPFAGQKPEAQRCNQKVVFFYSDLKELTSMILKGPSLENFNEIGKMIELQNVKTDSDLSILDVGLKMTINNYKSGLGSCIDFKIIKKDKEIGKFLDTVDFDAAELTDVRIALEYAKPENKNDMTVFESTFALPESDSRIQLALN